MGLFDVLFVYSLLTQCKHVPGDGLKLLKLTGLGSFFLLFISLNLYQEKSH